MRAGWGVRWAWVRMRWVRWGDTCAGIWMSIFDMGFPGHEKAALVTARLFEVGGVWVGGVRWGGF